jgi:hypothetical protein
VRPELRGAWWLWRLDGGEREVADHKRKRVCYQRERRFEDTDQQTSDARPQES